MTLPVASNLISLSDIQTEFGGSDPIGMDEYYTGGSYVNAGQVGYPLGVSVPVPSSGLISFANFHGATKYIPPPPIPNFSLTIGGNVQNYNLRTAMIAAGYSGSGAFTVDVTINGGVWVWSDNTGLPAFDTGALSGGTVTITNNGYIIGKGGIGGHPYSPQGANGQTGGHAVYLQIAATIVNNTGAYIASGGGGGGGGPANIGPGSGGGAGGGNGSGASTNNTNYNAGLGGAGGGLNNVGANGTGAGAPQINVGRRGGGGGGGRQLPGSGGAAGTPTGGGACAFGGRGGGAGGGGGVFYRSFGGQCAASSGGAGGSGGGGGGSSNTGGGGGWGASGGSGNSGAGGTGGRAIALNGYSVSRSGGGTTYGAIS